MIDMTKKQSGRAGTSTDQDHTPTVQRAGATAQLPHASSQATGDSDSGQDSSRKPGATGRKRGPKPGTPQARKGGLAAARKYGHEFYERIGRKGGETVKAHHTDDADYYQELGRRGGQSTHARHGSAFYAAIGRKGGQSPRTRSTQTRDPKTRGGETNP